MLHKLQHVAIANKKLHAAAKRTTKLTDVISAVVGAHVHIVVAIHIAVQQANAARPTNVAHHVHAVTHMAVADGVHTTITTAVALIAIKNQKNLMTKVNNEAAQRPFLI
jgi:hypothetical protein